MGVGFISVVSSDGIPLTLTISSACCSLSCDCTYALVITLDCREVWVDYACFGGAMVVNVNHLLKEMVFESSMNFILYSIASITLYFFQSRNKQFSPTSVLCMSIV
jgi:hypothetical protein